MGRAFIAWRFPEPSPFVCFSCVVLVLVAVSTYFWMSSRYFNAGCHRLHVCRVAEGLFP
jgi:hypothetical protein